MEKSHVVLSEADHAQLTTILHQSDLKSKIFRRVTTLLELHKGKSIEEVREVLGQSYPTVAALIDHYQQSGLDCLKDQPKSGRPPRIDGKQIKIHWQFSIQKAREKLNNSYNEVNYQNYKFKYT
jgi:transposase